MKILKLSGKYFLRFFECFVAFLFFYLAIVIIGQSFPVGDIQTSGDVKIYIRSNNVHTEFCLPSKTEIYDWTNFLQQDDFPQHKSFRFVSIGWGDKGFFLDTPTWDDLTFSTAFNAAFLPSPTAMHVTYNDTVVESESCIATYISKEKYQLLIQHIKASFRLKEKSTDLIKGKGYGKNDNFYEAHGNYHLFRTCNTWTNAQLKAVGIRTASYALFQGGIMDFLRTNK